MNSKKGEGQKVEKKNIGKRKQGETNEKKERFKRKPKGK